VSSARQPGDDAVPRGVLPVFQTPYREDGAIDWETLDRELEWLFQQGADGVVMAMVSEVLRLTEDERRQMAHRVCTFSNAGGWTVISIGAESTRLAVSLAEHAESVGATAVMAIPPVSIGLPSGELKGYYRQILNAVRIPVIVQDASGYVGRPLPIATQAELLHEFGPQRVMFKPESAPLGPNLSALRDATSGAARIFEGSGGMALVDNFRRGITGTMPAAELIDAQVALWQALEAGDEQRIYELSLPISALVALQTGLDGYLAIEKHLLARRGIFRNEVIRGPVGFRLDEETRREADRLFDLLMSRLASC